MLFRSEFLIRLLLNYPGFKWPLKKKRLENNVRKAENAGILSFSRIVSFSDWDKFCYFSYLSFIVCKRFRFGPG